MRTDLPQSDLLFLIETLMPHRTDGEAIARHLRSDKAGLAAMLDDERLFRRLMEEENVLIRISPRLFFTVLLRRAWRDLQQEAFTVEKRDRQKVVLFDADRVVDLLAQEPVRDYLAAMLASFVRIDSVTVLVETARGAWRAYRTNELDVEGMMRYSRTMDEPFRFAPYKRIADACLFLTGMFPDYISGQYRYPASGRVRPHIRGRLVQKREDYEAYGRAFYRMAAEHTLARRQGVAGVLRTISENFILAEKPLVFLSNRYLQFARHSLFGV